MARDTQPSGVMLSTELAYALHQKPTLMGTGAKAKYPDVSAGTHGALVKTEKVPSIAVLAGGIFELANRIVLRVHLSASARRREP